VFKIGLAEIALIGLIFVLVMKPEDIPGFFRAIGDIVGRYRRGLRQIQNEIRDFSDQ